MNILHIKTIIEEKLSKNDESISFSDALDDCLYACSLGKTALKGHIRAWLTESGVWNSDGELEYIRGIEWVKNVLDCGVTTA